MPSTLASTCKHIIFSHFDAARTAVHFGHADLRIGASVSSAHTSPSKSTVVVPHGGQTFDAPRELFPHLLGPGERFGLSSTVPGSASTPHPGPLAPTQLLARRHMYHSARSAAHNTFTGPVSERTLPSATPGSSACFFLEPRQNCASLRTDRRRAVSESATK